MKSLISVQSKFPGLFSSGIRKKTITRSLAAPPWSFYSHENSYSETITRHKSLLVEAACHLCLFLKYHSHDFSYRTSVLPSCSPYAQNHADFCSCLLCSIWCSWDSFRHVTTVYSPLLLVNVHYTITSLSMFNGHVVFSSLSYGNLLNIFVHIFSGLDTSVEYISRSEPLVDGRIFQK